MNGGALFQGLVASFTDSGCLIETEVRRIHSGGQDLVRKLHVTATEFLPSCGRLLAMLSVVQSEDEAMFAG